MMITFGDFGRYYFPVVAELTRVWPCPTDGFPNVRARIFETVCPCAVIAILRRFLFGLRNSDPAVAKVARASCFAGVCWSCNGRFLLGKVDLCSRDFLDC